MSIAALIIGAIGGAVVGWYAGRRRGRFDERFKAEQSKGPQ